MYKIITILSLLIFCSCNQPQKKSVTKPETDTPAVQKDDIPSVDPSILASPSTLQNMTTGYWHIGGAISTKLENGQEGYTGKWFKFHNDMTFETGQNDKDLFKGDWRYNDEINLLTLSSKNGEAFFLMEWKAKVVGDIIILVGSGQIKLVRADTKVVDYNIN